MRSARLGIQSSRLLRRLRSEGPNGGATSANDGEDAREGKRKGKRGKAAGGVATGRTSQRSDGQTFKIKASVEIDLDLRVGREARRAAR